jgi:hypothetical protein
MELGESEVSAWTAAEPTPESGSFMSFRTEGWVIVWTSFRTEFNVINKTGSTWGVDLKGENIPLRTFLFRGVHPSARWRGTTTKSQI